MILKEIAEKLNLEAKAKVDLNRQLKRGYASDLLSDVLANAKKGDLWITLQIHHNIVAVACMKEMAGIVLVNGREPEEETLKKAESEEMPILSTKMSAFELVGRLYAQGMRGETGDEV